MHGVGGGGGGRDTSRCYSMGDERDDRWWGLVRQFALKAKNDHP